MIMVLRATEEHCGNHKGLCHFLNEEKEECKLFGVELESAYNRVTQTEALVLERCYACLETFKEV